MEVNCDRLLKSLIKIRPAKEFEKYLKLDVSFSFTRFFYAVLFPCTRISKIFHLIST
jgi:hypothetical protein